MTHISTSQSAWGFDGSLLVELKLPSPERELMSGVKWGSASELFSAAFWKYHAQMQIHNYESHKLGRSLMEEVAVCLLGGFGMPAEMGLAAFDRLRDQNLLDGSAEASDLEEQLSIPFFMSGKQRRYRFPKQKAKYLSSALQTLDQAEVPTDSVALRNFLTSLAGIGPKTASWVVRNHNDSDEVAILDVHIIRAGLHLGLYSSEDDPSKVYYPMERKFLDFCEAIGERASLVDALMWDYMRRLNGFARTSSQSIH